LVGSAGVICQGELTLRRCTIEDNRGCGVDVNEGRATLLDCVVRRNRDRHGAGILVRGFSKPSFVRITGGFITGNAGWGVLCAHGRVVVDELAARECTLVHNDLCCSSFK